MTGRTVIAHRLSTIADLAVITKLARLRATYRDCGTCVRSAWWLLIFSIVGWPTSAVGVALYDGKVDPFEQLMLFLS